MKEGLEAGSNIQGSWIPKTPYRPILPKPASICSDMQENKAEQTTYPESDRGFSLQNLSGLNHLPFGDLLALANAASAAFVGAAPWAYHENFRCSYIFGSNSQTNCHRVESPSAAFSFMSPKLSNGLYSGISGNGMAENSQYGLATSFQDMENGVSPKSCSEFYPVTPQKPMRTEGTNQEIDEQGNEVLCMIPNSHRIQCITGDQESVKESSLGTASVPAEENNNNEKGESGAVEQIKTPEKPKRKKHRPKVITEAKPKTARKPKTPRAKPVKPYDGEEKPSGKRKYVRKKGVNKDSTSTPVEAGVESAEAECLNPQKKSCRRSLKFGDEQNTDENYRCKPATNLHSETQAQACCNGENQSNSDIKLVNGIESLADIAQTEIASDLTHSGNQELKESISLSAEGQATSTPLPGKSKRSQRKRDPHPLKQCKGDGRLAQKVHTEEGFVPQCLSQSGNAFDTHTENRQAESKKENLKAPGRVESSGKDRLEVQFDIIQEHQKLSWLYFPNTQKKKSQNSATATLLKDYVRMGPSETKSNHCITSQSSPNGVVMLGEAEIGILNKLHAFESTTCSNQKDKSTKKRPRSSTRARDLASVYRIIQGNPESTYTSGQGPAECDSRPQKSTEPITSQMQSTLSKKKRTKKSKELQMKGKIILQQHHQFSAASAGTPPDELWKQMFSIDAISERLRLLDINRESPYIPYQEMALVPYAMKNQDQNALVLYRGGGTIVPFAPVRKRRPRPRVNLDNETNRVWNLLMGNINSEGIDGTDEEKTRWWEEERRVFRGRADSFIARMHLVQGDRRFTPWKGSVVDSVIGVFLTQNVSDHLSSSAFMSMAARFPFQSPCSIKPGQGGNSKPHEPIAYLDSEESMSTPPVCNQSQNTPDNIEHSEEKEVANSDDTCRRSCKIISSTNESICKTVNSSGRISDTCSNSNAGRLNIEVQGTEPSYLVRDSKASLDSVSSLDSSLSSQQSMISINFQNTERTGSCSESNSEGEDLRKTVQLSSFSAPTTFMELLQMAGSSMLQGQGKHKITSGEVSIKEHIHIQTCECDSRRESINDLSDPTSSEGATITSTGNYIIRFNSNQGSEAKSFNPLRAEGSSPSENNEPSCCYQQDVNVTGHSLSEMLEDPSGVHSNNEIENKQMEQQVNLPYKPTAILDLTESTSSLANRVDTQHKLPDPETSEQGYSSHKEPNPMKGTTLKSKGRRVPKEKKDQVDWDSLRREVQGHGGKRERTEITMDSVDWEAVRTTDVDEIAKTIKDRGMNNVLAGRIQDFLNRLVREHECIDLEWLRDIPPDKAKEYLLSIRGLGLKSVECVRLLTLHHLAFPVDTNVGRIAVRLGWVPLQPLPESLQLHLLELYPVLESIQKYLWPRLCKLDQRTLYELHYQMITFGKVFCTKSKPNCNACPMRGECRHFASAFASARLALPGPEAKSIVGPNPARMSNRGPFSLPQATEQLQLKLDSEANRHLKSTNRVTSCEPIIEEPATPEPECTQALEHDIEDEFWEDPEEIPTIRLNIDAFTDNLRNYMQQNMELQEGEMSKALVALTAEVASIPMPKLKNVSQLRTEHQVYELPDFHPLLEGLDKREPDDPCSYLLAIWTPGETADSIQPPDRKCSAQENGKLCDEETCFSCNSIREARSQTVRGTLLIPCRTAMRGSFPLNGTYFQVNEVFADHDSSLNPIDVPRDWIWSLPRKTVYFGTSIPTIFRGLTTEGIQHCFWRGYVCVRGFDQKTRAPRPLMARLHFPASKLSKTRGKK